MPVLFCREARRIRGRSAVLPLQPRFRGSGAARPGVPARGGWQAARREPCQRRVLPARGPGAAQDRPRGRPASAEPQVLEQLRESRACVRPARCCLVLLGPSCEQETTDTPQQQSTPSTPTPLKSSAHPKTLTQLSALYRIPATPLHPIKEKSFLSLTDPCCYPITPETAPTAVSSCTVLWRPLPPPHPPLLPSPQCQHSPPPGAVEAVLELRSCV